MFTGKPFKRLARFNAALALGLRPRRQFTLKFKCASKETFLVIIFFDEHVKNSLWRLERWKKRKRTHVWVGDGNLVTKIEKRLFYNGHRGEQKLLVGYFKAMKSIKPDEVEWR